MTARRALAPLLALLLLAACAAGQVIKIGTTQSLCGDGVEGSQSYRTALRFWEAYTNAHGGIDVNGTAHTVQLIIYNDAFDTNLISILYERLILVDQVDALISPFTIAVPAFTQARKYGVPIINIGDFTYYATKGAPNGTFGGWLFSAVPNTLSYISQCFDTMRSKGLTSMATAWVTNAANAGFPFLNSLVAPTYGITGLAAHYIKQDLSDLEEAVSALKRDKADFFSGGMLLSDDNVKLLAEMRKQRYNPKAILFWLGVPFDSFRAAAGWQAHRLFGPNFWDVSLNYTDAQFGSSKGFYDAFNASVGVPPESTSALAVFSAVSLKLAFEKAGTLDKAAVRDALSQLNEQTFFGLANYSAAFNQTPNQYYCFQVDDNGKLVPVSENAIAKSDVLWPASVPAPPGFYPSGISKRNKWIALGVGLGGGLLVVAAAGALLYWLGVKYQVIFIPKTDKTGEW